MIRLSEAEMEFSDNVIRNTSLEPVDLKSDNHHLARLPKVVLSE